MDKPTHDKPRDLIARLTQAKDEDKLLAHLFAHYMSRLKHPPDPDNALSVMVPFVAGVISTTSFHNMLTQTRESDPEATDELLQHLGAELERFHKRFMAHTEKVPPTRH